MTTTLTQWFETNVVDVVVDKLTSPEVLAKVAGAAAGGLDNVVAHVTTEADRVITTTATNVTNSTNSIVNNLGGQIGSLSTTLTANFNSVVSNLFSNVEKLIQHPFGL